MSANQATKGFGSSLRMFFSWAVPITFVVMLVSMFVISVGGGSWPILKSFDPLLFSSIVMVIVCGVASFLVYKRVEDDLAALLWWLYIGVFVSVNAYRFFGQLPTIFVSVLFLALTVFLIYRIHKLNAPLAQRVSGDGGQVQGARAEQVQKTGRLAVEKVNGKLIDLGEITELDVQARATAALAEAKRVQIEERAQALRDYEFALNNKDQYTKEELEILKRRAHQFDAPRSAEPKKEKREPRFRSGTKKSVIEW